MLEELRSSSFDYVVAGIAVLGVLIAIAALCAWGLKRLRQRAESRTVASVLVKHLGGHTRELVTTTSGKKLHFYECKSLNEVMATRTRSWEQCAHCQMLEFAKIEEAAMAIGELEEAKRARRA